MKLKIFTLILLAVIPFMYVNCSSGNELSLIQIPVAKTECLSIAAIQCNSFNNDKLLFVGISDDTSVNCGDYISGTPAPQLHKLFIASSTANAQYSDTLASLSTTHSSWKSETGLAITTLANKEFLFCAFIDSNGDSLLNANEPVLSQQQPLSDLDLFNLENWNNN